MTSAPVSGPVVRFGIFEADLSAGKLRRNGARVRLQDLPFRALALLLSRPGEVVTREDFRQALWPAGVFVDFEQGINSAMMRLRDALADSAENPIFIETIERRGYRWIAPIHPPEPVPEEAPQEPKPDTKFETALVPAAAQPARRWKAISILLVMVTLLALWGIRQERRSINPRPSVPIQAARGTADHEAEDFYLKGRFYWNKRTPESLNLALENFNQAIAHDPNYAAAYAGLADCYNLLREFSAMPSNEAYFKAFAAAKRAVDLDPESSDAHASLAFVTFWGMWDAPDAEKEFRRSIELDPKNPKAHHWFAPFLITMGRDGQALDEINRARQLDPNSSAILADQGEILRVAGHRDQALQLLQQLEAADPDFVSPHRYLRFAYYDAGDYPQYLAEFKKEALLTHNEAELAEAEAAARGLAGGGEHGMLIAELSAQEKLYAEARISAFSLAQTQARLGNRQQALRYLTICLHSHDDNLLNLGRDSHFASLHGDPGFQQLVTKIGLPPII